jgi:adenylate cyclase
MFYKGKEHRRLAAIMFTDMVGYSALAHRDEAPAVELLDEQRRVLRSILPAFCGREVETMGDGFLIEFASALEATRCAVEIQRRLAERNCKSDPRRQFRLRIGIHVGDVIDRGQQLAGDSINIAARVEPLASPGGICITRAVQEQVANKLRERLVPLGAVALKNISPGIEIFRIALSQQDSEAVDSAPLLPPESTLAYRNTSATLAVLPFVNMTSDPRIDYLADGLTEELITSLSQVPGLSIPGRTSLFAFKDHNADIRRIGRALNVERVLEGSVRVSGQRFRVNAQLVDAQDGFHLWSQCHDYTVRDWFEMQAEISREIVAALRLILVPGPCLSVRRAASRRTCSPAPRFPLGFRLHRWRQCGCIRKS